MEYHLINSNHDIESMRQLVATLREQVSISDFEELIQLQTVRQNTRLWYENSDLLAFAYVDDFNNLCFEISLGKANSNLESEIADWGMECTRVKNNQTGESSMLDSYCSADNHERIDMLKRMGFNQQEERSLKFSRSIEIPIENYPLPFGYSIRCVNGETEVPNLVSLHRAAFGTNQMTEEYRLAMMHTPDYDQTMDWVAVAPDGTLAAFCIGSIDEEDPTKGYLDPIGTHPNHQRIGLSKAMITYGLTRLNNRGIKTVQFGTSSENLPMRALAIRCGFELQSESVWFIKNVS